MSSEAGSSTPCDPSFRIARVSYLAAIIALLADDELGAKREDTSAAGLKAYKRAFSDIAADKNNEIIVAEIDGEVVGCLQLTLMPGLSYGGGKRAQLEAIRVARNYRGKAIGHKLIAFAIARARTRGAFMMQLTSNTARDDAHRFYQGLGFSASHTGFKLIL